MLLIVRENGFKNNDVYLPLSSDKALCSDLNVFSNNFFILCSWIEDGIWLWFLYAEMYLKSGWAGISYTCKSVAATGQAEDIPWVCAEDSAMRLEVTYLPILVL